MRMGDTRAVYSYSNNDKQNKILEQEYWKLRNQKPSCR